MIRTRTRYYIFILSLIALLCATFIGWAVYSIKSHESETNTLRAKVDEEVQQEELIQSIKNTRAIATEEIASFERVALKEGDLVPLIETIESKARSLGLSVEITSVENVETKSEDEPDKIKIIIQTNGSWKGSDNFLHALEALPYRVMLTDIVVTLNNDEWNSRFTLNLYTF